MTTLEHDFLPGNLVRARGREWVVQADSRRDWLRLRPLGGAEDETTALIPELELQPVEAATAGAPLRFDAHGVLARVAERGDLFADLLAPDHRATLPAASHP